MIYEVVLQIEGDEVATAGPSQGEGEPGELQPDQYDQIEILNDIKKTNTALVFLLALLIFFIWIRGFFRQ